MALSTGPPQRESPEGTITMSISGIRLRRGVRTPRQGNSSRLYRDATSLASSSMLTALLGVGFWIVAARLLPPSKLGVQTALLSAITAPAIVIASGVGDAFTAVLPAAPGLRASVLRRGYSIVLALSVTAGLIAAIVSVSVLHQVRGSVAVAVVVLGGTVVWAFFTVQDPALTSMGRAHWLPFENGAVSTLKVAIFPALAAVALGLPMLVATIVPAAAAVAVLLPRLRAMARSADDSVPAIDYPTHLDRQVVTRQFDALTLRTTSSVALTLGSLTFLPFVVTVVSGPVQGAVFALCLSVNQSLDFVGSALGVSLVVHASAPGADGARMARQVLRRAASIVGVGAIALVAASPLVLRIMNPTYLELHGIEVIAILCAGSLLRTGFVTWSALQRARRQLSPVLILNAAGALTLYATLPLLCDKWGAVGAALSLASAQTVLSIGACLHVLSGVRRARTTNSAVSTADAVPLDSAPTAADITAELVPTAGGR
ncbi:MAG: lipopolysaccharide biosynthesis protein [Acidothermaceae bacterium]